MQNETFRLNTTFGSHFYFRVVLFAKDNDILLGLGVSICLDMVSIETLDLDTGGELVSTVEIFLTVWKTTSRQSRFSRQFEKWHLDKSRQFLRYKVSIFIFVSIETLDLDTGREPVSTVEKISTLQKS